MTLTFNDFTEARHAPSQHHCNRYPVLVTDENGRIDILCWDCLTIWHTSQHDTGEATMLRAYREAELTYGGNPKIVSRNDHHPLFFVYNLPAGYRRCVCCGHPKHTDHFGRDNSKPDGFNRTCRACRSLQVKESRQRKREGRARTIRRRAPIRF